MELGSFEFVQDVLTRRTEKVCWDLLLKPNSKQHELGLSLGGLDSWNCFFRRSVNWCLILVVLESIPRFLGVLNAIVKVNFVDSTVWSKICRDWMILWVCFRSQKKIIWVRFKSQGRIVWVRFRSQEKFIWVCFRSQRRIVWVCLRSQGMRSQGRIVWVCIGPEEKSFQFISDPKGRSSRFVWISCLYFGININNSISTSISASTILLFCIGFSFSVVSAYVFCCTNSRCHVILSLRGICQIY